MKEPNFNEIEKILNYKFKNRNLLTEAFTHSSFANIHNLDYHYERLEFLGDSVLGLTISEYVFNKFTQEAEGTLTHLKSHMVNSEALSTITEFFGLNKFLLVPANESNIKEKKKIKENLFESIIGAIYLDSDLDNAKIFILTTMEKSKILISDIDSVLFDPKTKLQELVQKIGIALPKYEIVSKKGPVHDLLFKAKLSINGKDISIGIGKSKKEAHQMCAKKALEKIENNRNWQDDFKD